MREMIEIGDQLQKDGLVAEAGAQRRHGLGGGGAGFAGHHVGGGGGRKLQEQEVEDENAEDGRHGLDRRAPQNLEHSSRVRHSR
jgi:hypothetical protein